jgi:hypothetical protein
VQLFKNFPAFCGTKRFITVFTRALDSKARKDWRESLVKQITKNKSCGTLLKSQSFDYQLKSIIFWNMMPCSLVEVY